MFNDWINCWGLIETKDPCRSFSWSNNQESPILATLDRILVSTVWGVQYPLVRVNMLPRGVSDHNPLRVSFGDSNQVRDPLFRFEKWWLEMADLEEVVKNTWNADCSMEDPIDRWQFKIRSLRRKLKGWHRNREAEVKKKKASQDRAKRKELNEKLEVC
jgi:hypothetical protein